MFLTSAEGSKRQALIIPLLSLVVLMCGCQAPPARSDDAKQPLQTVEDPKAIEPIEIDPKILEPLEVGRLEGQRIVLISALTADGEEVVFYPQGVKTQTRDAENAPAVRLFEMAAEARIFFRENPCCVGSTAGSVYKKWRSYCYPNEWVSPATRPQCQ